ncbi:hypothetical protein AAGS61_15870 [Lysinibacillus sp. KU-BSD001]|uniref:hypothetical protein n=1 Tax=Lysinibacillus sp. KU-BSD001 TaxID=3141328 RepID=UPI0036EADB8A
MMKWFLLYIVVSAIIMFFFAKGDKREWLFKLTIVITLPVIGWLFPSIWPKKWIRNKGHEFQAYMTGQTDDIPLEFIQSQSKVERERELNVISIEEALIVSDYSTRRRVMIDVLKQDAMQYLDVLKIAVTNEDTETSHYAVTAVIEVKRELSILLQKLSVEFNQDPNNQHVALTYANVIKEYLRSGFLDEQSTKQYQITYTQILQQLIDNDQADEEVFAAKVEMELKLRDTHAAEKTALSFKKHYPLCEKAYLSLMATYYQMRAFEKLAQELQNLKATPITLSNQALTIVRYWSAGVNKTNEMVSS